MLPEPDLPPWCGPVSVLGHDGSRSTVGAAADAGGDSRDGTACGAEGREPGPGSRRDRRTGRGWAVRAAKGCRTCDRGQDNGLPSRSWCDGWRSRSGFATRRPRGATETTNGLLRQRRLLTLGRDAGLADQGRGRGRGVCNFRHLWETIVWKTMQERAPVGARVEIPGIPAPGDQDDGRTPTAFTPPEGCGVPLAKNSQVIFITSPFRTKNT